MGGSGKTSLLNVLSGRVSKQMKQTGEIMINNQRTTKSSRSRVSGYVTQDDVLFARLTVIEQLTYSGLLRLPSSMSRKQKKQRVKQVIDELGLTKCMKTRVGNELLKGVSGGERKRTAIGSELIADPRLIFLDEPTSGLDSFTAVSTVRTLKNLASAGRTVVCTIHQPRSNIVDMFDQLILLARGNIIYQGPASGAITYFAGLDFRAPRRSNPAD